jgi:ABC-type glycerol-3-phosphate transport system substrate-binding protein
MGRILLVALACMLAAAAAFAQTTTTTTTTTTERVTITGTLIGVEEGTAANYQPAKTLVVRTDKANPERFELYGNGLVYDKLGRVVTGPIKPGTRVRVFYANMGRTRVVDHVELQE